VNKNYLIGVCGVGLLGLFAGSIPVEAKPTATDASDASTHKVLEERKTNADAVAHSETANESPDFASTQRKATRLSEVNPNLNTNTGEVVKPDASIPSSVSQHPTEQTHAHNSVSREAEVVKLDASILTSVPQNPTEQTNTQNSVPQEVKPLSSPLTSKLSRNPLQKTEPVAPANSLAQLGQPTSATTTGEVAQNTSDPMGEVTGVSQLSGDQTADPMGQVTNVTQLSDVRPTDWAYEALRSLVERYGCIAGYPDGTFRGNRAMTRYEFAAGLNACLQQIERIIASSTSDFVRKSDLEAIQRLVSEFKTELAALGTRVDKLEGRVAFLEDHQFSTTTKLNGQAIFSLVGAGGGAPNGKDGNLILVDRVRLNLVTSFTGKDTLITGLQAYNFLGDPFGGNSLQNTLFPGSTLTSGMTKLSFEPLFPGFDPKNLSTVGANSVNLYKLLYIFPLAKRFTVFAGTAAEVSDAFPTITPFADEGQEAISRFAAFNPVLRVSGGTSGTGLASAAGFIWNISDKFDLRALYGNVNANIPGKAGNVLPGVSGTPLGGGVFRGSNVVATQLTIKPTNAIDIGLNYAHSYHEINILGTGLSRSDANALGGLPLETPVQLNSFGATVTWRFTPKIAFSGYGAYITVDDASRFVNAGSNFTSWMVGVHFNDLVGKGDALGLIFGQPLYRVDASGSASLRDSADVRRATPYHLEGYYRFKLTNNISITPGAFVLFNPEGNSRNDTTYVGVLRTTFTF
jgi:hypothetical protein